MANLIMIWKRTPLNRSTLNRSLPALKIWGIYPPNKLDWPFWTYFMAQCWLWQKTELLLGLPVAWSKKHFAAMMSINGMYFSALLMTPAASGWVRRRLDNTELFPPLPSSSDVSSPTWPPRRWSLAKGKIDDLLESFKHSPNFQTFEFYSSGHKTSKYSAHWI